tara:strand:+ start:138 stop:860 length:723 start_codon:yes stop_codon:yes gene_type:complete
MSKLKSNKNINGKDLNGFALSLRKDGQTYRKGDTTAYLNVGQPPEHRFTERGEFVATAILNPEERRAAGKKSPCIHISVHTNILDAAYSASVFNADRSANVESLNGVEQWEWDCGPIPAFDYAAIDTAEHAAYRNGIRSKHRAIFKAKKVAKKARLAAKEAALYAADPRNQLVTSRTGNAHMRQIFGAEVFMQLGRKYKKTLVERAMEFLTINEFCSRFGLDSKVDINRIAAHRGPFKRA